MRAVISDASPLIFVARLGHFDWLRIIYGKVIVPKAVWDEVMIAPGKFPESRTIQQAVEEGWMAVVSPTRTIPGVALELDPGEREAIALAEELNAWLIIDDMAGRLVAQKLGISVTGTAGVLLTAKLRGLTNSLKEELDRLQNETTFWLSDQMRKDLLRQASENE